MLGESFIGQVIDLFGVFVQAEQCLFLYVIPEFGASHGWLVVTNAVCCSNQHFSLLIIWSGANILLGFSFLSGYQGLHDQGEKERGHQDING